MRRLTATVATTLLLVAGMAASASATDIEPMEAQRTSGADTALDVMRYPPSLDETSDVWGISSAAWSGAASRAWSGD
jgi:hypothetical protein